MSLWNAGHIAITALSIAAKTEALLGHIESLEADKERLTKALGQACELGGFKIGTCPENKAWIEHDACGDWVENKPEIAQWLKENQ